MPAAEHKSRPDNAKPMVGWYDPRQLVKTGVEVLVSTLIGRHSDHRIIEAVIAPKGKPFRDYTHFHRVPDGYKDSEEDPNRGTREEIWVDYVADTGDGWDPTYAVAYAIAHPERCVTEEGGRVPGERGSLLIMGGDQVYPTASRKEYKDRLIAPYEAALRCTVEEHPQVLAIPGNHDWYDSLVSFSRVFIGKGWFAGWFAPQDRSYFACKLPHGWWLLGIDTQLGADVDGPQVEYFEEVADQMGPDDRVILCCAEPQWIFEKFYSTYDKEVYTDSNLHYLNRKVLKGRVRVYVAGDLHHYRRHANALGVQKITCGGGGAFLHPTHAPKAEVLAGDGEHTAPKRRHEPTPEEYTKQAAYPDEGTSRWIARRNLLFPFLNPLFGVFIGIVYFIAAWAFMLPTQAMNHSNFNSYMYGIISMLIDRPAASFWAMLMVGGWIFFTDTHSKLYQWVAGGLHGLSHLFAVLLSGWVAGWLVFYWPGLGGHSVAQFVLKSLVIFVLSGVIGSLVMGIYLLISLNVFGRHYNEAFSSLAIMDYKCFMRFHVDKHGSLTIYPMGIKRVPTKWKDMGEHAIPRWEPENGKLVVELIEDPIKVDRDPKNDQPT